MFRLIPGFALFPYTTLFRSFSAFFVEPNPTAFSVLVVIFDAHVDHGRDPCERVAHEADDRPIAQTDSVVGLRDRAIRSEEHTSELQSRFDLVCRLLLEKKNY